MKRLLAVLFVSVSLGACSTPPSQPEVVARAIKASVSLEVKINQFGADLPKPRAFCSGTVVRPGVVLTNRHCVVAVAGREIFVRFYDGRLVKAAVLHIADDGEQSMPNEFERDETPRATDAALLSVDPRETRDIAPVADSIPLVGEAVFAIGSPAGLRFTVTFGHVSFRFRDIENPVYGPNVWIQHDAAINPGNSGGGLFNERGELVGVNTLKAGDDIGLSVPILHILHLFKAFL